MDKASRAIRRSGVKLLSLSGGHGDLNVLVSDIKDIKNCAKAFMNAQHLASQDMSRWASHEENRAVQDVVSKIAELLQLWSEVQKSFIGNLKDYRQLFEMILEGEKNVSQAKDNLDYYQEKEMKGRKEMKKVAKRASAIELRILQSRVEMAEKARECAQVELNERLRENEAVKLIRMKEGLLKMSSSYIEMANKCNTIFMAERDIAIQLPDVHGREIENIKYSGFDTTRFIVEKARDKVQSYSSSDVSSDPPPPYTPPESSRQSSHQNSADASGVHHSYSDQRLAQSQIHDTPNVQPTSNKHRHSLPYDTRPVPGRRQSCDPRLSSSSDSNMCQMNQNAECSNIPTVTSSQSLSREGDAYPSQGIMRENSRSSVSSHGSVQGVANLAQNIASSAEGMAFSTQGRVSPQTVPLSENPSPPFQPVGASHNIIHQQPSETIIHTNIVQIRQVVDLPPYEEVCNKSRHSLGPEYTADSQNSDKMATEYSCSNAGVDQNFQFADDDEDSIPDGARSLRPIPAPRSCSSGEGYATAEEDQDGISKHND